MMHTILIEKLRSYIAENNPEVMLGLQQDMTFTSWLEQKVAAVMPLFEQLIAESKPRYAAEELCMNALTADLRPSRFNYIKAILKEEFEQNYERFREMGVLTYETVNLIETCKPVFEESGFTEENEDDRGLRYAIIGAIDEYLNPPKNNP